MLTTLTDVVMPQMGESIAEGTIVRWVKQVGDHVEKDEPLFEISTDKVDAEIPSPAAGRLVEIRVPEGATVPIDTVVAVIAPPGVEVADVPGSATPPAATRQAVGPVPPVGRVASSAGSSASADAASAPSTSGPVASGSPRPRAVVDVRRRRSSPLVRSIAKTHGLDIATISGSGASGRVTKRDILAVVAAPRQTSLHPHPSPSPSVPRLEGDRVELLSLMRRKIAEHMVLSRKTSAHVHSVFEVDFSTVTAIREQRKAEFAAQGLKLTYLAFIVRAVAKALREVPALNASLDGETVVYHDQVNIGVAVSLGWGLIVPVIRHVDTSDLLHVSREIVDLAARARGKQLKLEDVAGGTFTVTNPGSLGALFGLPIINQPQVGILGVGGIEKRPVVVDDAIVIRPTALLTLGFDHRLIDGALADQFMSHVKKTLERWDASLG